MRLFYRKPMFFFVFLSNFIFQKQYGFLPWGTYAVVARVKNEAGMAS